MRRLILAAALLLATPLEAQTPPAADENDEAATATMAQGEADRAARRVRRTACREAGYRRGLRGPNLSDDVAICVEEMRLACLKKAVAEKVRGPVRRSYLTTCLEKGA